MQLKNSDLFIGDAFINGDWVSKDAKFDVFEPSTATVLGQVANCSLEDFQWAITSAYNAQSKYYESTTAAQRGALLRRWNDLILANADDRRLFASLKLFEIAGD